MSRIEEWVIDATFDHHSGGFAFCPVETDDKGEITAVLTGLTYLGDKPPRGDVIAVVHEDGQDAVEDFYQRRREEIDKLIGRQDD